jgi:ribosome maturation factor RimP
MRPLTEKTNQEMKAIAAERGLALLAVETAGAGRFSVLRLVLERASGEAATIEDCEAVSREVSALLDASDEIGHRYTLEVSSAGLDRRLYSLEDARRFLGNRVVVRSNAAIVPEPIGPPGKAALLPSRNFAGTLEKVEDGVLTVVDGENRRTYNVRFADIRQARLDFAWPDK